MGRAIRIPPLRADGLQLEEHRTFQQRYWRLQRVGWLGYGIAILIALLGLTGSGGVFHMQEVRLGNAVAQIPRVARWEASDEIRVTFNAPRGEHDVTLGMEFFDRFEIGRMEPEPQVSTLTASSHRMRFAAEPPGPHSVHIALRPMHFGWTSFTLGLDGESQTVHVLILP